MGFSPDASSKRTTASLGSQSSEAKTGKARAVRRRVAQALAHTASHFHCGREVPPLSQPHQHYRQSRGAALHGLEEVPPQPRLTPAQNSEATVQGGRPAPDRCVDAAERWPRRTGAGAQGGSGGTPPKRPPRSGRSSAPLALAGSGAGPRHAACRFPCGRQMLCPRTFGQTLCRKRLAVSTVKLRERATQTEQPSSAS